MTLLSLNLNNYKSSTRILLHWHAKKSDAMSELIDAEWHSFFLKALALGCFENGIEVHYAQDKFKADAPYDYFICYEPREEYQTEIIQLAKKFKPEQCVLISCRENPVAHHYRRWRFKSELTKYFGKIFSSMGLFADAQKYFWVPFWNFLKFENKTFAMLETYQDREKTIVVNPLRSGGSVNPVRNQIISDFVAGPLKAEVYGKVDLFDTPPFDQWKSAWRAEIPYAESPANYYPKIDIFQNYRFVLVVENVFVDGYITEKLGEALAALTIPIYFGPKNVEYYLPELFNNAAINGHKYANTDELMAFIESLSEAEVKIRVENILKARSSYLELTARHGIWSFILETTFNLPYTENSRILSIFNQQLASKNKEMGRAQQRLAVQNIIEGELEGLNYEAVVRERLLED